MRDSPELGSEREKYYRRLFIESSSGKLIEFGELVRGLRSEITMLNQEDFSRMCKIPLRSLQLLEIGVLDPEVDFLNAILMHFGYQVGITKCSYPVPERVKFRRDRPFAYEHHAWHHD